ncbi:MAG TPA: MCP four helix bundle domain-containing protein, partial [Anaeromyxobacter sp.]
MKNMAIGVRLSLAFTALLVITLGVAASGYSGLERVTSTVSSMLAGEAEVARLSDDVRATALGLRRFEKDFFLNIGNADEESKYARQWADQLQKMKTDLDQLDRLLDESQRHETAVYRRELDTYVAGFQRVQESIRSGAITNARDANLAVTPFKDPARAIIDQSDQAAEKHQKGMRAQGDLIDATSTSARNTMLTILVAAIVVGALVSLWITRSITTPL